MSSFDHCNKMSGRDTNRALVSQAEVMSIVINSLVMMGSQHVRAELCCLVWDSGYVSEQVGGTEWGFRQGSEQTCGGGGGGATRSAWLTQVIRRANEA
jgi:hypothetical protein